MFIKVLVITGSKKEELLEIGPNRFKVFVKEKPVQNTANQRVIMIIAKKLSVNPSQVKIISGHHHPSKLLSISSG